jgi:serine/threonine protein kinase
MGATFSNSNGEQSYKMKLSEDKMLGEGSFAQVYKVKRKKDGLECAAKLFKVPLSAMNSKDETGYERELQILKQANHPFLI